MISCSGLSAVQCSGLHVSLWHRYYALIFPSKAWPFIREDDVPDTLSLMVSAPRCWKITGWAAWPQYVSLTLETEREPLVWQIMNWWFIIQQQQHAAHPESCIYQSWHMEIITGSIDISFPKEIVSSVCTCGWLLGCCDGILCGC